MRELCGFLLHFLKDFGNSKLIHYDEGSITAWVTVPKGPGSRSRKGLGNGPERARVTVPKGPGSRGNRVTWPRHEFQKGLGHVVTGSRGLGMSSKRAWVTVPKRPGSGSRKGLSHGPKRARLLTYFGFYTLNAKISKLCKITRKMIYAEICRKLQNVRKCAENNKLCGNVRKTVNCAIPHPSHLICASGPGVCI